MDNKKEEPKSSAPDFDKTKYEKVKELIEAAQKSLERVYNYVDKLQQDERKEFYTNIPGLEGTFDGQYIVSESGEKKEVPGNYAAKSKLVYGDKLKFFKDGGKGIFKQIDRVERKKITGILSKKEGKWYILSDSGSYKVSDVSAEFYGAHLNDEAEAFIPAGNLKSPFAALEKVISRNAVPVIEPKPKKVELVVKKHEAPVKPKIIINKTPKKVEKAPEKEKPVQKEYVAGILEDDDLR